MTAEQMRIFDYAVVADWDDRIAQLAGMAEPERWTYVTVPDESPLPVLDSYLRYTFLRLHEEGKVTETDALACFNTGLLTPDQEEIFGIFSVSERFDPGRPHAYDNKKWFLKSWARSGDRILTTVPALPALASYWTDPSELIFNPAQEVRPNIDHILRENLTRFPTELGGAVDSKGVPLDLKSSPQIDAEGPDAYEPTFTDRSQATGPASLAARVTLDGAVNPKAPKLRLSGRSTAETDVQGR